MMGASPALASALDLLVSVGGAQARVCKGFSSAVGSSA